MANAEEFVPVLNWFRDRVEEKLGEPQNVAKGHWNTLTVFELRRRLQEESLELLEAFHDGTTEEIISECCDIAAFAMMIADNARFGKI